MKMQPWLTAQVSPLRLGVTKETIYNSGDGEKIPAHRVGKLWKFKPSEVDQWVMSGGATSLDKQQDQQHG